MVPSSVWTVVVEEVRVELQPVAGAIRATRIRDEMASLDRGVTFMPYWIAQE